MKVPFLNLHHQNDSVKSELEMAFRQVLESNSFVLGDNVKTFEKRYATFNQTKEAIGVSSGLDALILSLRALEIGPEGSIAYHLPHRLKFGFSCYFRIS